MTAFLDRCRKRMARIDNLSPEIRSVIHDHGFTIVDAFLACGVKNARHIRHLITVVQNETRYGNPHVNPRG